MPPTSPQHNPNSLDESLGEVTKGISALSRSAQVPLDSDAKETATQQLAELEELLSGKDLDAAALTAILEALEEALVPGYGDLPAGVQAVVPRAEYSSRTFVREATERGFTPYQWAGVQGIVRQARPDREVDPATFSPAPGGRGLKCCSSLVLARCRGLVALPSGLAVLGSLDLSGCTALVALPEGLTLHWFLHLRGCAAAVQRQGSALKGAGKIRESHLILG